jgi:hypothetical protein
MPSFETTDANCDRERLLCPAREKLLRENERLRGIVRELACLHLDAETLLKSAMGETDARS